MGKISLGKKSMKLKKIEEKIPKRITPEFIVNCFTEGYTKGHTIVIEKLRFL